MFRIEELTYDNREIVLQNVINLLAELRENLEEDAGVDKAKVVRDWLMNRDRHRVFAALDNDRVVGVLTLQECFAIYANGSYGIINELYVVPEYRSKGVGKTLVEKAANVARLKGWQRLDVTAPLGEKWQRTVDFYLREGFVHTGPKLKMLL